MIFALVKDLFFRSKMDATAQSLGKKIEFVSDVYTVKNATLVVADLEEFGLEGMEKILEHNPGVKIIGFLSHKRMDLMQRAKILPITVMPRSAFSEKLREILSDGH